MIEGFRWSIGHWTHVGKPNMDRPINMAIHGNRNKEKAAAATATTITKNTKQKHHHQQQQQLPHVWFMIGDLHLNNVPGVFHVHVTSGRPRFDGEGLGAHHHGWLNCRDVARMWGMGNHKSFINGSILSMIIKKHQKLCCAS